MEVSDITVLGPKTCPNCKMAMVKLTKAFGQDKVTKQNIEDGDPIIQKLFDEGFASYPVLVYKEKHYSGVSKNLADFISQVQNGEI